MHFQLFEKKKRTYKKKDDRKMFQHLFVSIVDGTAYNTLGHDHMVINTLNSMQKHDCW